jgi:hypothetical protein
VFSELRRGLPQYLTPAGYLLLLIPAFQLNDRVVWLVCLGLISASSALAWLANLRRCRAIADTPTSRIGTAAQGFVELCGVGKPLPGMNIVSPARQLPCLWYRYKAYEFRNSEWEQIDSGESDAEFLLDDGSGLCLMRPYDAEVVSDRKDTYRQGDIKHVEETLLAGERLYALGGFVSRGGSRAHFDDRIELDQVLTEWKRDTAGLKQRFDLDGNGAVDTAEWSLAVSTARREVAQRRQETQGQPAMHSLDTPGHGKPYLIANFQPERLARRYRYWAWGHAAMALIAAAALAFVPG